MSDNNIEYIYSKVEVVPEYKYLGVKLDSQLEFSANTDYIIMFKMLSIAWGNDPSAGLVACNEADFVSAMRLI